MNYQLTLNEKQARILSCALDTYARIAGGQFSVILHQFSIEPTDRKHVDKLLAELKLLLTGKGVSEDRGLHEISEDGQVAYDLHQVVRYSLRQPKNICNMSDIRVSDYPPLQYSHEPLAIITEIK